MTNFDVFLSEPAFQLFITPAINAEKIFPIDTASCVLNCRRSLESALKWMYTVDDSLDMPDRDSLIVLLNQRCLRDLLGDDLWRRTDVIRRLGNLAAHEEDPVPNDKALLCLENLFLFLSFIAHCYGTETPGKLQFDPSLPLASHAQEAALPSASSAPFLSLKRLEAENVLLKNELTARRAAHHASFSSSALVSPSPEGQQLYIDTLLRDAGWIRGKNCLPGASLCPSSDPADALLLSDDGRPLALVEWTRTCVSPSHGRYRALRQADEVEKQFAVRPIIFLTDGFHTFLLNDAFEPERPVSGIYSQSDLLRLSCLQTRRLPLKAASVSLPLVDRPYQQEALKAALTAFEERLQRRCLISMAPGVGKTRVALAACALLTQNFWAEHVLILCENMVLLNQTAQQLQSLLPHAKVMKLQKNTAQLTAPFVLSTADMLMQRIDHLKNCSGNPISCGHFDLIICDEATSLLERSGLLNYFDARCLALTVSTADSIDPALYDAFEMGQSRPTYSYAFSQAVQDGYLVPFTLYNTRLRLFTQGVDYQALSAKDLKACRAAFPAETRCLSPEAFYTRVLNRDTYRQALRIFMENCLWEIPEKQLGKTVFFASGRRQARLLLDIFREQYPHWADAIRILDSRKKDQQAILREFMLPESPLRIVISLQLMDSGIDVPQILNLAFFRRVSDQNLFLSMLGRGCRLCPHLSNGKSKIRFHVFDFLNNTQMFSELSPLSVSQPRMTLEGEVFLFKSKLCYQLSASNMEADFRHRLSRDLLETVRALNLSLPSLQPYRKQIEQLSREDAYEQISYEELLILTQEIAPLIPFSADSADHLRVDLLFYEFMLFIVSPQSVPSPGLPFFLSSLLNLRSAPVKPHLPLLRQLSSAQTLQGRSLPQLDRDRLAIRSLGKYLNGQQPLLETDIEDQVLTLTVHHVPER